MVAAFLVESSSWWIKGSCPPGSIGLYVSRSNIYLYFGRFFTLAFNALMAFSIERGAHGGAVALTLGIGFLLAAFAHLLFLRGGRLTDLTLTALNRLLLLPRAQAHADTRSDHRDRARAARITLATGSATFLFSLGASLPLLLAVLIPSYRMSLSYVGQLVNAGGTLLLLFLVDQTLFKSLDQGTLASDLPDYSRGRMLAFALAGVLCCCL